MSKDKDKKSPMMQKYLTTKELYKDAILLYQLGDFYEMFYEDAITASNILELTLTSKSCGNFEKAPMCGIPIHALDNYLYKLVSAGYKVAICDQTSDPSTAGKELVTREVVKVVTQGTLTENVEDRKNNYIMSIAKKGSDIGICYADITTGKLNALKLESFKEVEDCLARVKPAEIIVNAEAKELEKYITAVKLNILPKFYLYENKSYNFSQAEKLCKSYFSVNSLSVFDILESDKIIVSAVGGLIEYLNETQMRALKNINKITVEKNNDFMHLDSNTRKNLELTENMTTRKKKGSLLGVLDRTKTSMGARLIRTTIEQPITSPELINERLDGVEELINNKILSSELETVLSSIHDIERITGKIAYGSIMPKECITLKNSLVKAMELRSKLKNIVTSKILTNAEKMLGDFSGLISLLDSAIKEDAPTTLKEGGYIKRGYNSELDTYLNASTLGKQWLVELEAKLVETTNIKNLKVKYNRVFGYYIEVTNSQLDLVPNDWIRRQTTTGGERFINEELKLMEDKILNSESLSIKLEASLYADLKDKLKNQILSLQTLSSAISAIDMLLSFATVAIENNYVRPEINSSINKIEIIDGRHPVVEELLSNSSFVPNDTLLDGDEDRTTILTGPNMAGKSTYMRQVAIISLMAHIGSFVPAREAKISLIDRIFTRIGASDDLAFGQSTFMVEMTEVANILHNATNKSLLILDEIGRGTSTYDGLSIAWSVLEYLSKHLKCKTLFATHYHELTDLEGKIEGIKNYRVLVRELSGEVVFLHKIARGSANKSFGIEVAKLAGLPEEIVSRAKEILYFQENANTKASIDTFDDKIVSNSKTKENINIAEVISVLSDIDMNTVSPLVAFSTLQNLVDKVRKG